MPNYELFTSNLSVATTPFVDDNYLLQLNITTTRGLDGSAYSKPKAFNILLDYNQIYEASTSEPILLA